MAEKITKKNNKSKAKTKRKSKGQRTHIRRMKQEARNTDTGYKKP